MNKFFKFSIAGVLVLLSGCAETGAPEPSAKPNQMKDPELVERLYVESLPLAFAAQVAKRCPTIRLKPGTERPEELRILAIARQSGVTSTAQVVELLRKVNQRRVQQDGLAFISDYEIVVTDRATWCEAGQTMIARDDEYGRFLVSP